MENIIYQISESNLEEVARRIVQQLQNEKETTKPETHLLSVEEVMAKLYVSRPTIWRWCKHGILTPIKIGKKVLFDENTLNSKLTAK